MSGRPEKKHDAANCGRSMLLLFMTTLRKIQIGTALVQRSL
jgi:hypothetical protein